MKNLNTICRFITVIIISLGSTLAINSFAAKQTDDKQYRTTPGGEGALTPKMLRNCIKMKKSLDDQAEEAELERARLEEINAELKRAEEELLEAEKTLDQKDEDAVTRHNAKIEALKELLTVYQEKTQEYNAKIEPYTRLEKKLKNLCDNQPYYDEDYTQAKEETGYSLE